MFGELTAIVNADGIIAYHSVKDWIGRDFVHSVHYTFIPGLRETLGRVTTGPAESACFLFQRNTGAWWVSEFISINSRSQAIVKSFWVPDQHLATNRELQVCWLLAKGHTNRQIARLLGIRPRTVGSYIESLKLKWHWPDLATFRTVCGVYRRALRRLLIVRVIEVPRCECLLCTLPCMNVECQGADSFPTGVSTVDNSDIV